jgi:hypothetical protein
VTNLHRKKLNLDGMSWNCLGSVMLAAYLVHVRFAGDRSGCLEHIRNARFISKWKYSHDKN